MEKRSGKKTPDAGSLPHDIASALAAGDWKDTERFVREVAERMRIPKAIRKQWVFNVTTMCALKSRQARVPLNNPGIEIAGEPSGDIRIGWWPGIVMVRFPLHASAHWVSMPFSESLPAPIITAWLYPTSFPILRPTMWRDAQRLHLTFWADDILTAYWRSYQPPPAQQQTHITFMVQIESFIDQWAPNIVSVVRCS